MPDGARVLSIPQGGRAELAKIGWPDDQVAQRRFSKKRIRGRSADWMSEEEFRDLLELGGILVSRKLEEWGIATTRMFEWLLDPNIVVMSAQIAEIERRNLVSENSELTSRIINREYNIKKGKLKGSTKGGQSTRRRFSPTHVRIFEHDKKECEKRPDMTRVLRAKVIAMHLATAAKTDRSLIALTERTILNLLSRPSKP
jgi:hypothetical protein